MNAFYKTIFFFGVAAVLLAVPLTVAADDGIQDSPSIALAAGVSATSFNTRTSAQTQVRASDVVVVSPGPVSLRHAPVRIARSSPQDGRATLRSVCLLRC